MWSAVNRRLAIGLWSGTVAVAAVWGAPAGAWSTVAAGVLLLASVVPPAVALLVWPGIPPLTAAEMLQTADRRSKA